MEIVGEFVGKNQGGKNQGGFVLSFKSANGLKHEIAAVGIERTNSAHPNVSYQDKVKEVIRDAEFTVDQINELLAKYKSGELQ